MRTGLLLLGFIGLLQAADLPRSAAVVRIAAVEPASFTAGARLRIAGEGLVFTWQANPTAANPASRMLRVGDRYLRIARASVSDGGRELLLDLAPEAPWLRTGAPEVFRPDPAATTQLEGPLGLTSLAVAPSRGSAPDTDVFSPIPVRWHRGEAALPRAPALTHSEGESR